mmetsp:Transcript_950/g.3122  ORF Transcript_950/g.3122 Transcript_950/m.3122 type:complete len:123 (-) Transcript_950:247-615(-)
MTDPSEVARAFVQHYYQTYDSNPDALAGLYTEASTLTFEGQEFKGPAAIVQKLKAPGQIQHDPNLQVDVQLGVQPNALCIFVTGHLKLNGENPLHFTQFFQLVASGPGQYTLNNDMFRLIYS